MEQSARIRGLEKASVGSDNFVHISTLFCTLNIQFVSRLSHRRLNNLIMIIHEISKPGIKWEPLHCFIPVECAVGGPRPLKWKMKAELAPLAVSMSHEDSPRPFSSSLSLYFLLKLDTLFIFLAGKTPRGERKTCGRRHTSASASQFELEYLTST